MAGVDSLKVTTKVNDKLRNEVLQTGGGGGGDENWKNRVVFDFGLRRTEPRWIGRLKWIFLGLISALVLLPLLILCIQSSRNGSGGGGGGFHILRRGDRYHQFEKMLTETPNNVTTKSELDDPASSSSMALQWLVHDDEAQISPMLDNGSINPMALQRFALATFFFATQMNDTSIQWTTTGNWLSSNGICGWAGVRCLSMAHNDNDEPPQNAREKTISMMRSDLLAPIDSYVTSLNLTIILGTSAARPLKGTLPDQIFALSELVTLDLGQNHLHGTLPKQLGRLYKLEELRLNQNRLQGALPSTLGQLKRLRTLDLHSNQLTSIIPSSIGDMTNLVVLNLKSNQFMGTIHSNLGNLIGLEQCYLNDNELLDEIPSSLCYLRNNNGGLLWELTADCGGAKPMISCDCCTKCTTHSF